MKLSNATETTTNNFTRMPSLPKRKPTLFVQAWVVAILLGLVPYITEARSQGLIVSDLETPSGLYSSQAHLSAAARRRVILSWVENHDDAGKFLKISRYDGIAWSEPKTVINLPAIWDLPKVIALNDGALGAVWGIETKSGESYTSEVYVSRSVDDGRTWLEPLKANSDRKVKTKRYSAHIAALPKGEMAIVWSDARNSSQQKGVQSLMGAVMNAEGQVGQDFAVDDDICSCCQLLPTHFKDKLYVTYRDHLPGQVRDIALIQWPGIRSADPVRVHKDDWALEGCPGQYVGTSATDKRMGVAWFTAAGGQGRVQAAFTETPETGFGKPVNVDPNHNPQGQVKMVMLDDEHALVQWIRATDQGQTIQLAVVATAGEVLEARTLNKPDWDQGFEWPNIPSLEKAGDTVYLAWRDQLTGRVRLKTIQVVND